MLDTQGFKLVFSLFIMIIKNIFNYIFIEVYLNQNKNKLLVLRRRNLLFQFTEFGHVLWVICTIQKTLVSFKIMKNRILYLIYIKYIVKGLMYIQILLAL